MATRTQWKPMDLSHLQARLQEVKCLLEQASALTAARDAGRVRTMTEIQKQKVENQYGNPQRQRYR